MPYISHTSFAIIYTGKTCLVLASIRIVSDQMRYVNAYKISEKLDWLSDLVHYSFQHSQWKRPQRKFQHRIFSFQPCHIAQYLVRTPLVNHEFGASTTVCWLTFLLSDEIGRIHFKNVKICWFG